MLPPPASRPARWAAASHRIDCSANVSLGDQRSGLCLPDSLPASGKESQRGALAYRKTCGNCHVEVGCGGTLHSEIHSTMAQAMHRTCEPQGGACGEAANGQGRGEDMAFLLGSRVCEAGLHSLSDHSCHPSHQVLLPCLQPQPSVPQLLVSDRPSHRDACGWVKTHHDPVGYCSSPVFLLYYVVRIQAHIQA